jgi:hypothetical protein
MLFNVLHKKQRTPPPGALQANLSKLPTFKAPGGGGGGGSRGQRG